MTETELSRSILATAKLANMKGRAVQRALIEGVLAAEGLDDERVEGLPPRFHTDSTLTVEVSANQTTFDFDLQARTDDARHVGKPAPRRNRPY